MPAGPPVSLPQPGGEDWGGGSGMAKRPHAGEPETGDGAGAAQPPVHDVFRQRRKLQRTRAAGGEAG